MSLLSCPWSLQLYRIVSTHPQGQHLTAAVLSATIQETLWFMFSVVVRNSYGISDTYINGKKSASILWAHQVYMSYILQRKWNAKYEVWYPAVLSQSVTTRLFKEFKIKWKHSIVSGKDNVHIRWWLRLTNRTLKMESIRKKQKLVIPFSLNECCVRLKANDDTAQRRSPERK